MENIIWAFVWFVILGGAFGALLAFAAKVFHVDRDERATLIRDALPGANCGNCGYSGCDSYVEAVLRGDAKTNACTVGGPPTAMEVGVIMGVYETDAPLKFRAQVMCSGTSEYSHKKYIYAGASDCLSATKIGGGDKLCPSGCIGNGSCVKSCKWNAISVIDGVAVVDYALCTGCGVCVKTCPKFLIKLIPYTAAHWVGCRSLQNGAETRRACDVGCISCRLCEKNCPTDAITVNDFIASIEYKKCIGCDKCVGVCKRKIIWSGKTHTRGPVIKLSETDTAS